MGRIESRLTYEHLRQLPDDGRRYELVEGDIVVRPAPKWRHQRVVFHLAALLRRAEEGGFGQAATAPTDVVLDPRRTRCSRTCCSSARGDWRRS